MGQCNDNCQHTNTVVLQQYPGGLEDLQCQICGVKIPAQFPSPGECLHTDTVEYGSQRGMDYQLWCQLCGTQLIP